MIYLNVDGDIIASDTKPLPDGQTGSIILNNVLSIVLISHKYTL